MAIPGSLVKIRYHGTLNTTAEEFTHTMHATVDPGTSMADVAIAATDWLGDFLLSAVTGVTGITDIAHLFSTEVHWDQVYVVFVNPTTGVESTPGLVTAITASGGNAVSGYSTLPYQVSHCITYVDGNPGVRTNRNRFYLPPYSTQVTANRVQSRLPAGVGTAIAGGMLNGNTAAAGVTAGWQLAVYSPHLHDANVATEVYIGDILDTQRRRRRSLGEVRTVVAL